MIWSWIHIEIVCYFAGRRSRCTALSEEEERLVPSKKLLHKIQSLPQCGLPWLIKKNWGWRGNREFKLLFFSCCCFMSDFPITSCLNCTLMRLKIPFLEFKWYSDLTRLALEGNVWRRRWGIESVSLFVFCKPNYTKNELKHRQQYYMLKCPIRYLLSNCLDSGFVNISEQKDWQDTQCNTWCMMSMVEYFDWLKI